MFELISLPVIKDLRGSLVALENLKNIPFEIKRVYYLFDTADGASRGYHAHKKLEQLLICVSGAVTLKLDDGFVERKITLSAPSEGVYIKGRIWREMHNFSQNCVLLVLANMRYDETDYIRDYNEFLRCAVIPPKISGVQK